MSISIGKFINNYRASNGIVFESVVWWKNGKRSEWKVFRTLGTFGDACPPRAEGMATPLPVCLLLVQLLHDCQIRLLKKPLLTCKSMGQ